MTDPDSEAPVEDATPGDAPIEDATPGDAAAEGSTSGEAAVEESANGGAFDESRPEATGGWLVLAVLVVGVLSMLLVGALLEAPLASQTTDLGIGFAWLLAAAYVGFRMEGRPYVRLLGATAFVAAAVARFVALLYPNPLLEATSLVGLAVGALAMLVVARD